jgi:hypothetical protein
VWDFSFLASRSVFFLAGDVLVTKAGGEEGESEGLGLGRGDVGVVSSILIFFFKGFASAALGVRLRPVFVGCALNVSSGLIFAERESCFAALFGASALELRVLFFFVEVKLSSLLTAEPRVTARAMAVKEKFRQRSLVSDQKRALTPKEQATRNTWIAWCMRRIGLSPGDTPRCACKGPS